MKNEAERFHFFCAGIDKDADVHGDLEFHPPVCQYLRRFQVHSPVVQIWLASSP